MNEMQYSIALLRNLSFVATVGTFTNQ